jgi:hypothetical protein
MKPMEKDPYWGAKQEFMERQGSLQCSLELALLCQILSHVNPVRALFHSNPS